MFQDKKYSFLEYLFPSGARIKFGGFLPWTYTSIWAELSGCIRSFECSHSTSEEILNLIFQTLQQTPKNNRQENCMLFLSPGTKTLKLVRYSFKNEICYFTKHKLYYFTKYKGRQKVICVVPNKQSKRSQDKGLPGKSL